MKRQDSQGLHHSPFNKQDSHAGLQQSPTRFHIGEPGKRLGKYFPTFLIFGPEHTGTTWLYHNLKNHPQIFLPREKESSYFVTVGRPEDVRYRFNSLDEFLETAMRDRLRSWFGKQCNCLRKYRQCYHPRVRGEATASNVQLPREAIREIAAARPGLKAILMLRDPIDHAWSQAQKNLTRGTGRQPHELSREEFDRFFRATGRQALAAYGEHVHRWTDILKPGHLFIGEFEMISSAPAELLFAIHRFLGIRSSWKYLNRHLLERINATGGELAKPRSSIPPEVRTHLKSLIAPELEQYARLRSILSPSPVHRAIDNVAARLDASPAQPKSKQGHPAA